MEYTSGTSTWGAAMRRIGGALRPRRVRRSGWSMLVPLVAVSAGLLFTTSARTAHGTNLREDRTPQIANLISDRRTQIDASERRAAALRAAVLADTNRLAPSDTGIAAQQGRADGQLVGVGLTAMRGPAVTVVLDDATRSVDGTLPNGATADDVVVHQQDVQGVVNALWAGGAEAMTIMGVRVISTSAVRCVGNTLLLQGRVYSPPFAITAIGDPPSLIAALDASPTVVRYRQDVAAWGLGYRVSTEGDVTLPAYNGSTDLQYATVPPGQP